MEKKFKSLPVGLLEVNCYFVPSPSKKTLYIIDPGGDAREIAGYAGTFEYEEAVILLTHAHVDHISGAGETAKLLGIEKLFLHPGDAALYASRENALPPYLPAAEDLPVPAAWPPCDPGLEILHTPGHTPGGVCFLFKEYNALFSGDTLFRASVGRTDLPGGDARELLVSIREKLMRLPDTLAVFPGHGFSTTVGFERENNPFL